MLLAPRDCSLTSFISFSQPCEGVVHTAPVPSTFDHLSIWSWPRWPELSLFGLNLFPSPAQVQSPHPSAHNNADVLLTFYKRRRQKKSSPVIPVKLWMKRIAGVILRRRRSPRREVFQHVTRVVALMRSCKRLQCRLFLPFTQCGATTPSSFISLSRLPHLWLEASSHSAGLVLFGPRWPLAVGGGDKNRPRW